MVLLVVFVVHLVQHVELAIHVVEATVFQLRALLQEIHAIQITVVDLDSMKSPTQHTVAQVQTILEEFVVPQAHQLPVVLILLM